MTVSARAYTRATERVGSDIEENVIGARRIARNSSDSCQMIETKIASDAPSDIVVGA